jgi:hypothetical protein
MRKLKTLCSQLTTIDSFQLFRNKGLVELVKQTDRIGLEIPMYNLTAYLYDDRYEARYSGGQYQIAIEKQRCYFGGVRTFFRCPNCDQRMRLLYCLQGKFQCRQCLKLGYVTQRLAPVFRLMHMEQKALNKIISRGGNDRAKPAWMKRRTFERLDRLRQRYEEKWHQALYDGIEKASQKKATSKLR